MDKGIRKKNKKIFYLIVIVLLGTIFLTFFDIRDSFNSGPKIGVVEVNGPIIESKNIIKSLNYFIDKSSISGIIIRINTPGGGVAASQEIYSKVRKISDQNKIPVIASMGGMATSGGYYIALGADTIVANPGTATGSIGVIMSYPVIEELMDKIGIKNESIKSGSLKDAGSLYRDLEENERKYFQNLINDLHQQFVDVVSIERRLPKNKINKLATGQVYSGRQALNNGLIDLLGSMEDAVFLAARLANIKGKPTLIYPPEDKKGLLEVLISNIFNRSTLRDLNFYAKPEYIIKFK